jgi:hypothetical protein
MTEQSVCAPTEGGGAAPSGDPGPLFTEDVVLSCLNLLALAIHEAKRNQCMELQGQQQKAAAVPGQFTPLAPPVAADVEQRFRCAGGGSCGGDSAALLQRVTSALLTGTSCTVTPEALSARTWDQPLPLLAALHQLAGTNELSFGPASGGSDKADAMHRSEVAECAAQVCIHRTQQIQRPGSPTKAIAT